MKFASTGVIYDYYWTAAHSRLHIIIRNQPTFISGSNSASLTLIPEQMNRCCLSGVQWLNTVTLSSVRVKFGYALEKFTSCSNFPGFTMSTVTQKNRRKSWWQEQELKHKQIIAIHDAVMVGAKGGGLVRNACRYWSRFGIELCTNFEFALYRWSTFMFHILVLSVYTLEYDFLWPSWSVVFQVISTR